MISDRMERTVRSGGPTYVEAVTDLWEGVSAALVRLERIAETQPGALGDELVEELPGLQYSLHAGAELAVGIDPPLDGEALHQELVAALAEARDATSEVALAVESGDDDLVSHLLPEWRGSLFRVRLARLRALERFPRSPARAVIEQAARRAKRERPKRPSLTSIVAAALVLGGALLFTAGAVLVAWPVWAAGLALLAGGFVLSRP
jgi:hypothetical protein